MEQDAHKKNKEFRMGKGQCLMKWKGRRRHKTADTVARMGSRLETQVLSDIYNKKELDPTRKVRGDREGWGFI